MPEFVIASGAKQSTLAFLLPHGLLRCARNDGKIQLRDLAARRARVLLKVRLPKIRGRRECRALDAPAASRGEKNTRVSHRRWRRFARHSPRNGFNGFLRALPGDRACSTLAESAFAPVRADIAFHRLDASVGASGPHDFAVRVSTVRPRKILALRCHRVHRIPRPTSVTIAKRPSVQGGTARDMQVIWVKRERKYF